MKSAPSQKRLLVIGGRPTINWYDLFKNCKIGKAELVVEFSMWDEMVLTSYSDSGCIVSLQPSKYAIPNTPMNSVRSFQPDFLLIRGACMGVFGQNWKNTLLGFMYCNIPSVNTLESLYNCLEKPVIYSKLLKIHKELGDKFPLIPQTYYPSWTSMNFNTGFPLVAKLGTVHAGFGKMKLENQEDFDDLVSLVAMQDRYITTEPYIKWDYDFRIQKIGNHYRAFQRVSSCWKGKGMNQTDNDVPLSEDYKRYVDLASNALGMDICALDGIHDPVTNKNYIIELNDSAVGLVTRHTEEDLKYIKELVLQKMIALWK
ncbi:synapsin-3, putative [Entamoeba invadens IP1]|uniref:Synapsin-3, putative n=1 Tax=Entamoeba invadens IP1 TaxID=370355 RepID=A0A0A1TWN8_ENTIV|nr:synapsin-3, putative [Entamoeba invadens IP1]ELP85586.1 synapsin-3, putative [Entamoeba invadens IP1]|eukprot:XP_004184932.1 synapsin-3, putative [Entamoeba invadens IP1]